MNLKRETENLITAAHVQTYIRSGVNVAVLDSNVYSTIYVGFEDKQDSVTNINRGCNMLAQ